MTKKSRKSQDEVTRRVIAGLVMLGGITIAGFLAGGAGYFAGAAIMKDSLFGLGELVGGAIGLLAGYPLGVAGGIILFQRALKYHGSLILGIAGTLLGTGIIISLSKPFAVNIPLTLFFALYFTVPPVLATGGFYLKRKQQPAARRKSKNK